MNNGFELLDPSNAKAFLKGFSAEENQQDERDSLEDERAVALQVGAHGPELRMVAGDSIMRAREYGNAASW